ncbi:MAG: hypothetical protein QM715_15060 [Nibricoccus sp.]
MKKTNVVRTYYILPCCLLLLNICNSLVSYKADMIGNPIIRVFVIIFLVLVGSSLVAYFVSPAIEGVVRSLYKSSEKSAGGVGQTVFLAGLGILVFFLYYQLYIHGPASLLPAALRN